MSFSKRHCLAQRHPPCALAGINPQCYLCLPVICLQVKRLEAETSRLAESERQTAAELGQRLLQISAKGQQAADSLLERDLLSSAVATVQARMGCCFAAALLPEACPAWHASRRGCGRVIAAAAYTASVLTKDCFVPVGPCVRAGRGIGWPG